MLRLIRLLFGVMTMSSMVDAFTTTVHIPLPAISNNAVAKTCSNGLVPSSTQLNAMKNKKQKLTKEELSYLEVRDMTREEMLELNAQNERVMNQELTYMTVFSLIISAPLLYLAWVGFFAETAEIAM
jgi:selenocysteine-specific elongation factor